MVIVALASDVALVARNPDRTARCIIRAGLGDQVELDVPAYERAGVPQQRGCFEYPFTPEQQADLVAWLASRPTIQSRVTLWPDMASISPAWRWPTRP
jgi:hypothetical protein